MSIFAAVVGAAGCYADEGESSTLWGLRAAVDFNFPSKWHSSAGSVDMYSPGFGVTLGGICNVYLGKGFYLEPGVSLFYDTYSFKDLIISNYPNDNSQSDPGLYKLGVRIPVVAGYSFDITDKLAMCVYTGPEFSYSFAGKVKVDNNTDDLDVLFGDWQRRADVAWKVGIGFPYKSVMMSVDAAFGMTDLLKTQMRAHDNRLAVSLTYYL